MSGLLYVYKNMKLVGKLTENHEKFFYFQYEKDAEQISLTMPYQNEPYNNRLSKPFFENMLPEGDILITKSPFKENKEFLNKIVNYIEHTYNKIS